MSDQSEATASAPGFHYVATLPPEIDSLRTQLRIDAERVSRLYNVAGVLIVVTSAVATLLTSLSASNNNHTLRYSAAIATAIAGIFSGVSTFFKLPQELARRWAATKYMEDACRKYLWGVFKPHERLKELAHAATTAERIIGGDVEKVAITESGTPEDPEEDDKNKGRPASSQR